MSVIDQPDDDGRLGESQAGPDSDRARLEVATEGPKPLRVLQSEQLRRGLDLRPWKLNPTFRVRSTEARTNSMQVEVEVSAVDHGCFPVVQGLKGANRGLNGCAITNRYRDESIDVL